MSANHSEIPPIFLHGLWRCGSTYIWSKFRMYDDLQCYYEPLHHGLAKITKARIQRDVPDVQEGNRHPALALPYFDEFKDRLGFTGRGVKGFYKALAYDRFWLAPGDNHRGLAVYLRGLIASAQAHNLRPLLGLNRSVLRIGWMKRNFQGTHIFIKRDPREIWWSYKRYQRQGNDTYFTAWLRIVERNSKHPFFEILAQELGFSEMRKGLFEKDKRYYSRILKTLDDAQTYHMVFKIASAAHKEAQRHADLIFDLAACADEVYVRAAEKSFLDQTGCKIDLSDFAPSPLSAEAYSLLDFEKVEQTA